MTANLTSARLWDRIMHGSGLTSGDHHHHNNSESSSTTSTNGGINVQSFIRRKSTGGPETSRKKQVHFHFRQRSYDGEVGKNACFGDGAARYVFRKGTNSVGELSPPPHSTPSNSEQHFLYGNFSPVLHEEFEVPESANTNSLPGNINSILDDSCLQTELTDGDQVDGILPKISLKKHGDKNSSRIRTAKQKKAKQKDAHRSKSLTQIDCLDTSSSRMVRSHELDSARSEPETSPCSPSTAPFGGILLVPPVLPAAIQGHQLQGSADEASKPSGNKQPQKMPSQELFSVTFDQWDEPTHYELLPAAKGILLRDALQGLLDRRGIDINAINVYLDSSNTPLSLHFETFRLGGNHLHVRARDPSDVGLVTRANSTGSAGPLGTSTSRGPATRSNSSSAAFPRDEKVKKMSAGSQRARRNALMLSDELIPPDGQPPNFGVISGSDPWKSSQKRPPLARKTGIFSNPFKTEREKMELLSEFLNQYTAFGIPELPGLLTFHPPNREPSEDVFYLEDHWSHVVANAQDLSKRMRNQQDAIWELLHTEVFYIRRLIVINDLFLACLCNLQNECLLNEIDTERMFSNISEIYASNQFFWVEHLLPMLNASRTSHQPLDPSLIKDGFLRFETIFTAYIRYCIEHQSCLQYVKDRHKDNELFKTFVAWCETQKDCERLRLVDLLVKPVQRLTKYSLLLKAIHKKTDDDQLKLDLVEMNESVESFVLSVDAAMRQRCEQERLSSIIGRIESYDVIDTNNVELDTALREHCVLDLTCPMPGCGNQQSRQLLMEGSGLKLRESSSSKVDVHCFLFTDMLLICKAKKGDRVRVIRQPYVVDRLVLSELRDGSGLLLVYLNEYRVATAAFILYTSDIRPWIENIRKAQELYGDAKAASARQDSLGFLKPGTEDDDYDFPSTALMVATRGSPRSSSRSSLVHSHSGSVDMSDPTSAASGVAGPNTSPVSQAIGGAQHPKAVSIELGELRNASLNCEDVEMARTRSSSVETRVCVTLTSPRPERRAFLLRGANSPTGSSPGSSLSSDQGNTLSLSVPCLGDVIELDNQTLIQVPLIQPPAKNLSASTRLNPALSPPRPLQRIAPINAKPPLVKTKNVSGLVTHSAPPSEGPSPVRGPEDFLEEDEARGRGNRRNERRYHTADSIENLKKEKDTSIHKRLSWNCGQQCPPGPSERLLRNSKQGGKCLSSESVYSSSGVSSTGSVHQSTDCDTDILEEPNSYEGEIRLIDPGETSTEDPSLMNTTILAPKISHRQPPPVPPRTLPVSNIKIDVSEVKEGISSVQITVNGQNSKPSKDDLRRLKKLLLDSCSVEASEV